MRTLVHSSQLQFTRDGSTLVVAGPHGVTFVELRGDRRRRIAISGVQAVAVFADQVWVVTRTGVLIRLGTDGRQRDEHVLPIDPDGLLIPTTIGVPAALWIGRESVMLLEGGVGEPQLGPCGNSIDVAHHHVPEGDERLEPCPFERLPSP